MSRSGGIICHHALAVALAANAGFFAPVPDENQMAQLMEFRLMIARSAPWALHETVAAIVA